MAKRRNPRPIPAGNRAARLTDALGRHVDCHAVRHTIATILARKVQSMPRGLVIDGSGNVYVADTGNGTLRKIAVDGTVTTLALTASSTSGSTPPPTGDTGGGSSTGAGTATASGGGGGAMDPWFILTLVALSAAARMAWRLSARPPRHS